MEYRRCKEDDFHVDHLEYDKNDIDTKLYDRISKDKKNHKDDF